MSRPKQDHGNVVKWICRYLLGTRDKGIMWKMDEFNKDEQEKLTCYIDSDFAGNYIHEVTNQTIQTLHEADMDMCSNIMGYHLYGHQNFKH